MNNSNEKILFYSELFPHIQRNKLQDLLNSNILDPDQLLHLLEMENLKQRFCDENQDNRPRIIIPQVPYEDEERCTKQCLKQNCDRVNCYFYHNIRERRRPLSKYIYEAKPCFKVFTERDEWLDPSQCKVGDQCGYCHTSNEILYYVNPKIPNIRRVSRDLKVPRIGNERIKNKIEPGQIRDKELMVIEQVTQKVLKENAVKKKDTEIKASQISILDKNISELYEKYKELTACGLCGEFEFMFINIPCTHVVCYKCSNEDVCQVCGKNITFFRVHFRGSDKN